MSNLVSLKNLTKKYNNYLGSTFVISDCPYYISKTNIHTYTMTLGTGGGCKVLLDNGSKVNIPRYAIEDAPLNKGIYNVTSRYYRNTLVLPVQSEVASCIQNVLQSAIKSLNDYKHLYENKKNTVNHIYEVLANNPEYLI